MSLLKVQLRGKQISADPRVLHNYYSQTVYIFVGKTLYTMFYLIAKNKSLVNCFVNYV